LVCALSSRPDRRSSSQPSLNFSSGQNSDSYSLIAPAVLPASAPALLPLRAVELRLAKLTVDVVVSAAQPLAELISAVDLWRFTLEITLEVLGTYPAWI